MYVYQVPYALGTPLPLAVLHTGYFREGGPSGAMWHLLHP